MPATYENIATTTLGSNQSSVVFNSISGYTDIFISMFYRDTRAQTYAYPYIRFNSDSGSNYSQTNLYADGSSALSNRLTSQNRIQIYEGVGDSATANIFAPLLVSVMNYANSTTNKTVLIRGNNTSGSAGSVLSAQVGLWRSTSAITSIEIFGDTAIKAGTIITLYGIKAA